MNLARMRGTAVVTRRNAKAVQSPAPGVEGAKWLMVEDCDQSGKGKGEYLVALDMVGADRGQMVLLTQGSSCRWTYRTDDRRRAGRGSPPSRSPAPRVDCFRIT